MYIIPLLSIPLKAGTSVSSSNPSPLQQIWLFLERNATHLIEIPTGEADGTTYAKEFAEENGFTLLREPELADEYVFLFVDPGDPGLADFYTWREIAPASTPLKEGWRPFLWARYDKELNRFLEEIQLGDMQHTAYKVLSTAVDRLELA